jgi:hypothetical protein
MIVGVDPSSSNADDIPTGTPLSGYRSCMISAFMSIDSIKSNCQHFAHLLDQGNLIRHRLRIRSDGDLSDLLAEAMPSGYDRRRCRLRH